MRLVLIFSLWAGAASAESLVATRMLRAHALVTEEDVALVPAEIPGALSDPAAAIGQELRVAIYPGRPLRSGDLGPPTLVERNQIVPLAYRSGVLAILTEGRALGRASAGEMVEVMNLGSRSKVTGRVGADGTVYVSPGN